MDSWENYFNSSNCLKIFQIKARGTKPCASSACAVLHALFLCHPGHHNPAHSSCCVLTNRTSPTTSPLPGTIISHWMTATGLPAPVILHLLPASPQGRALKNINQIQSAILQTSPLSQLMTQLSHVIFTKKHLEELSAF